MTDVQLSPTEMAILCIVAEEPNMSVGELAIELMPYRLRGNFRFNELTGKFYVAAAANALATLKEHGLIATNNVTE